MKFQGTVKSPALECAASLTKMTAGKDLLAGAERCTMRPATVPVSQAFISWGSPQYSEQNTAGRKNILHALEANVPTNGKDQMHKNKK